MYLLDKGIIFRSLDHEPEVLEIENNTQSFEELVRGKYAIVDSVIDKSIVIIANENEIDFSNGFPIKGQHFL
ncbi:hypothetical protein BTO30_16195 [Domibacillus antri]|uniref:Uncharacterized protein n=1 Tax=Domibacillus antri TaxID=1714264 RepID=A0A1Q8Q1K8_9BACI|nr:hypothetical protein [Domibacillus antri]OLN21219.1 hypothetical protein BTO30_16195 [Domibacillus antri]